MAGMSAISKNEADAYDRILDAAEELAALIASRGVRIDEYDLEEFTIFLARNAIVLRGILKGLKYMWS